MTCAALKLLVQLTRKYVIHAFVTFNGWFISSQQFFTFHSNVAYIKTVHRHECILPNMWPWPLLCCMSSQKSFLSYCDLEYDLALHYCLSPKLTFPCKIHTCVIYQSVDGFKCDLEHALDLSVVSNQNQSFSKPYTCVTWQEQDVFVKHWCPRMRWQKNPKCLFLE